MTDVELITLKIRNILEGFIGKKITSETLLKINKTCSEVVDEHSNELYGYTVDISTSWSKLSILKKLVASIKGERQTLRRCLDVDLTLVKAANPKNIQVDVNLNHTRHARKSCKTYTKASI